MWLNTSGKTIEHYINVDAMNWATKWNTNIAIDYKDWRVVEAGDVAVGDPIHVLSRPQQRRAGGHAAGGGDVVKRAVAV